MRRIAFLSEKGGVGKSTLCVNIGAALATHFRKRVLLIDLDGMACVSQTLAPGVDAFEDTVGAALIGIRATADLICSTVLTNLFVVPGSSLLKSIEHWDLSDTPTPADRIDELARLKDTALRDELSALTAAFDYVLVDCPGGLRFMEQMALLACDEVIIPTGLAAYDYYAITPTLELIIQMRERRGDGRPKFAGFIPNGATAKGVSEDVRQYLEKTTPLFSAVRASQLLKSAPGWKDLTKRVLVMARPESAVAISIVQVAREIELGTERAGLAPDTLVAETHRTEQV